MEQIKIPDGYQSSLNLHDTQIAIKTVKDFFQQTLAQKLNLLRVSAPVFVNPSSGLNDNLNGVERPVSFDIKEQDGSVAEIVHSLAKWKRYALKNYNFHSGEGLYTDMSAIRRDEDTDNIHSLYVDQWDWEKVISKEERNTETLQYTVRKVYRALKDTE
ncbi:MAG: aspartate--ammonia ligase, partial [Dorea sp.]|nr:aspartate--ammonia ligase [Dorea sp.]